MKFVVISDTHGQHRKLRLPQADCIIHAGDISGTGNVTEVIDFLSWFAHLDYKHKIFIAGNHDFFFEQPASGKYIHYHDWAQKGVYYLNDTGVTLDGIKFWGSPITPWFYDWAFNRHRGEEIRKHWDLIPADTDILITHGPVAGILDKTIYGDNTGCMDLMVAVNIIKPKFHLCGHIHEAYGIKSTPDTTFINASVLNEKYKLVNEPVQFVL